MSWSYWKHGHNRRYELGKRRERILQWIVWRLPRSIVYWSSIRLGAHATQPPYGDQVVPDLLFMDALKRWDVKA